MRYFLVLYVVWLCATGCGSAKRPPEPGGCASEDSTMIYARQETKGDWRIGRRQVREFNRVFDRFYTDSSNKFYIRSSVLKEMCGSMRLSDVMVEMPRLDAATVRREGNYFIDKDKVICIFDNSDGGYYIELQGVDPGSFKVFKHVYGGRDKDHVFCQHTMLKGFDPRRVKVYSDLENCSNCDGYFKDGKSMYYAGARVDGQAIPRDFKFVE